MFKITRNNRRFNNKTFASYEQARSYVRKWLRKNMAIFVKEVKTKYSNPSISTFGFKIKAV